MASPLTLSLSLSLSLTPTPTPTPTPILTLALTLARTLTRLRSKRPRSIGARRARRWIGARSARASARRAACARACRAARRSSTTRGCSRASSATPAARQAAYPSAWWTAAWSGSPRVNASSPPAAWLAPASHWGRTDRGRRTGGHSLSERRILFGKGSLFRRYVGQATPTGDTQLYRHTAQAQTDTASPIVHRRTTVYLCATGRR